MIALTYLNGSHGIFSAQAGKVWSMEARRKKEIRSLVHTLPQLIKSHLVNQAFETEKIIATTFDFTDAFRNLMNSIPQNHIEKIADWYSKLSFKAFQGGINNAQLKLQTREMEHDSGEELDEEIKTKIPMPYTLSQHLIKSFQDHVGQQLETVPNANEIIVQLKQDLEKAYREGVIEHLETIKDEENEIEVEEVEEVDDGEPIGLNDDGTGDAEEIDEIEEEEAKMEPAGHDVVEGYEEEGYEDEEEYDEESSEEPSDEEGGEEAFLEEWLSEIEGTPTDKRQTRNDPIDKPIDTQETTGEAKSMGDKKKTSKLLKKDPILADVSENEIIKALEEYTRLPGDSQAENVLRYELGLPPRKAKASSDETNEAEASKKVPPRRRTTANVKRRIVRGGRVIGPYDTQALRQNILKAVKTHVIDSEDVQSVVVDSIVANINEMSEEEAAQAIAKKMEFSEALASESSLEDVKARADAMAVKLTSALGLPGDVIFLDVNGDYLLTFAFKRDDAKKLALENESTTTARRASAAKSAKKRSIPNGPQGVLSVFEKSQIEKLAALGGKKTMRDIKKASAKVAAYLGDVLKNIRNGRVGLAEGTAKLRANMADVIGEVFGPDGMGYYEYLTKSRKRA